MFSMFYIVGLLTFISTVNCQFRFDYSFDAKVGGWLKYHEIPANFLDAFKKCDAEGAVLASPLSLHLKNAMLSLYKNSRTDCALYTGIHSIFTKGAYSSVEGKPITKISMNWAPNEPDNFNDTESCIVMLQNGTMADVSCTETFPFICYKEKTGNMAINECGTVDNEYQLDTRTGSCYKFHTIGRTWEQAYMVCMAEGGHLAIINSETEAQVLKDLFAKYPADKIFSVWKDGASIGFHDWGETGVWYTVHGQKLQESGYWKFAEGEPNNDKTFAGGSSCGGLRRAGQLDDFWCSGTNIVFICEKKPDSLIAEDEYCQFRFDYTFNIKVGGWLKLHTTPSTFFDAFRRCSAEGAVLASPLNNNLRNAMVTLRKNSNIDARAMFTGINSAFSKATFASVEGVPIAKIPIQWAPFEPDNLGNKEDCTALLVDGTMADVSCTETFPFVCYKKKTKTLQINECGTVDDEYKLDHRTGSCYKLHRVGRSWRKAYMTCMAEGGYLAIINGDTEAEILKEIYAQNPSSAIFAGWKDVASIGIHDWGDRGVWYTVHGQTLKDAGYSKFSDGEPNNNTAFDGGSFCLAMFRTGLLDDVWCNGANFPFICEKDPDSLNPGTQN